MKLNELVRLRNQLVEVLEISTLNIEIEKNYSRLINLSNVVDEDLYSKIISLANNHKQINLTLKSDYDSLLSVVQDRIDQVSAHFFEENYQLELTYRDPDSIRQIRILNKNEEFEQILTQRINLYSNWQYPALEIGCRDGEWTKLLVASDPLYIADEFEEFLTSAVQQFSELYQGRIRKYKILENCKIANLPENQFGLIFSYNYFNYARLDSIKHFLNQTMIWLRPGGKIIFTYNNADLPAAAEYAEKFFMTYVPKSILQPMAENIGFETEYSYDNDLAFSMIEFKKPGLLESIKLSQVLGEIKVKN